MAFIRRRKKPVSTVTREALFVAEFIGNGYNATQAYAKVYKNTNIKSSSNLGYRFR